MELSRRRFLGRALLVLAYVYAVVVSIRVLWMSLSRPEALDITPQWLKVMAVLGGVAILGLSVFWVFVSARERVRGEGSQYLLSRTAQGTARISLRAIQASLLRRARELREVIGVKVVVRRPDDKRLRVEVAYTTTDEQNAILVSETLRRCMKERFEEIVKAEEGFEVDYDVKIDGLVPGSAPPAQKERDKEEPEPFTGPRYPID